MSANETEPLLVNGRASTALYNPTEYRTDAANTQIAGSDGYHTIDQVTEDEPLHDADLTAAVASHRNQTFIVYKRRWWLLLLFSLLSFMQGGLGNVWTVIAQSAEAAFNWTDSEVSLMQAWMYGAYLLTIFPFTWLMDAKGLRISMLVCGLLIMAATGVRCISVRSPSVMWCAQIGHALLGFSGPVTFTVGPVLSSMWFPPHQRATATAIATIAGFSGAAGVFIIGPMVVDPPKVQPSPVDPQSITAVNYTNLHEIREEIWHLRLAEFCVCTLIFLCILVYFPKKPPTPPSLTASIEKLHFKRGLQSLFKRENINFWLVAVPFGLCTSVYGLWSALFDVNLKPLGISEEEAGWFGFFAVAGGCVAAVIIGRIADLFGHMKLILVLLLTGTVLSTFWFLLQANQYIESYSWSLYTSVIVQGLCVNGAIPLFYELAIEATYPVAESVSSGMMTIIYQIPPLLFLLLFLIPNIGRHWMNWVMYGVALASFPMLVTFRERYKRLEIDDNNAATKGNIQDNEDLESSHVVA